MHESDLMECLFKFVHFSVAVEITVSVLVGVCLINVTSIQAVTD